MIKNCIDCNKPIGKQSIRCKVCSNRARITASQESIPKYNKNKPADVLQIEYIAHNTVLLTAYQNDVSTQMKYFSNAVKRALNNLSNGIDAYILDPLVYDSKQQTERIVITKNTIIKENNND